ncbi:MAG TPA: hypothetical protein VHC97_05190 [Thermoanaerobaculia bacterium]|nr:hypothetical protein [Thermoanaerobaculia bacterium]
MDAAFDQFGFHGFVQPRQLAPVHRRMLMMLDVKTRVVPEDRLVRVAVEVDPHVDAAGPAEPHPGPQRETELLSKFVEK